MKRGLLGLLALSSAAAVTIQVDTQLDEISANGFTSLREAVIWANTNAGPDTILLPAGTFLLSLAGADDQAQVGDLDVTDSVTIQGAGANTTFINANQIDRVFFLDQNIEVRMSDLCITGGRAAAHDGGGIYNQSTAYLVRCQIGGNLADNFGGGIELFSGALYLDQCAVYYNGANGNGAGGIDIYTGFCSLSNCTVSGNVSGRGAGLYAEYGELHLFSCTIVSNQATSFGGGINGNAERMQNTLVALNEAATGPDLYGDAGSQGFNLVGNASGASGFVETDLLDAPASVGALRYYGGPTPTHFLMPGSPAINRADPNYPTNTVTYDQRGTGYRRLRGLGVDIGAYEHQRPDHDLDGMPDEWEQANQLNPTNALDGAVDDDEDGFSNEQEYQADTDPGDEFSFFALIGLVRDPASNRMSFVSSTGRLYQAEVAPAVDQDTWTNFTAWLSGQAAVTELADTNPPPDAVYRVRVRAP